MFLDNWLSDLSDFVVNFTKDVLSFLFDLVYDIFVSILEKFLGGIGLLIQSIPAPDFFANHFSVGQHLSGMSPFFFFLMSKFNFGTCIGIIVAALLFRLVKRLIPFIRI